MQYDVVTQAESVMQALVKEPTRDKLTTSQIRKFLTAVVSVKNKVDLFVALHPEQETLSPELAMEVKFLLVTLSYQAGRHNSVKLFMVKADLESIIKGIGGSIPEFKKFCKYVEALVAYHKFYGGRDK